MGVEHDFTEPRWGHNILSIDREGDTLKVFGAGYGPDFPRKLIAVSDTLLLTMEAGKVRFHVEAVEYMRNPRDCFHATLTTPELVENG